MDQLGFHLPAAEPLALGALLVSLAIGFALALALRWHFERFASTLSNRSEFAQVFPLVVLTTVLIISVVKSSLALAIGLGLGAEQTLPTVLATLTILVAVGALRWALRGRARANLYLSVQWA